MNRRVRRQNLATIDMSPLMDLTFMLLIIFVITVPSIYYKSDVKLTPPESTTNDKMQPEEHSIFVELDKDGAIWLGSMENKRSQSLSSSEELTARLVSIKRDMPDVVVYLVGDQSRQYRDVVGIANAVQHAGIGNLSLVFTPETGKGGR